MGECSYAFKIKLRLLSAILVTSGSIFSSRYSECLRGRCQRVGDVETEFQFDQPKLLYLNEDIRFELSKMVLCSQCSVPKEPEKNHKIPNNIHMIWLGSPLPEKYVGGPAHCRDLNPGHTVHLWLDEFSVNQQAGKDWMDGMVVHNVMEEDWDIKDLVHLATNPAMASDILRMEIVYRYGGIYVDIDAVCVRPLGPVFHESFVTLVPPAWAEANLPLLNIPGEPTGFATLLNSPFGFPPNSSFLRFSMDCLRQNFFLEQETRKKTGPELFKMAFLVFNDSRIGMLDWHFAGSKDKKSEEAIIWDDPSDQNWND